jgi:acetyl esterase/lipase
MEKPLQMTRISGPQFLAAVLTGIALFAGSAARAGEVQVIRDVPYVKGPDADPERHQLDLYLPRGRKDFPVVVFVHGGAWMLGDKEFFGWGQAIGTYFARQGVAAVLPSYRLAPRVHNTDQAHDVARAIAWTYRNIGRYGGSPDRLFLCGHSAGGQLVALVVTDPRYLKAAGVAPSIVRGVVVASGVYRAPEIGFRLAGATGGLSGLLGSLEPAGGPPVMAGKASAGLGGLLRVNLFDSVFGEDPAARRAASPLYHVKPGLPPFLIFYAEYELPTLDQDALAMTAALKQAHCRVDLFRIEDRDHETVMFRARSSDDPVARRILEFVTRRD